MSILTGRDDNRLHQFENTDPDLRQQLRQNLCRFEVYDWSKKLKNTLAGTGTGKSYEEQRHQPF